MRTVLLIICVLVHHLPCHANKIPQYIKKIEGKIEGQQLRYIDFIYLINLEQRSERLSRSLEMFKQCGISPHCFPAIYGWDLSSVAFQDLGLEFRPGMSFVNKGWPSHSVITFWPGTREKRELDESCFGKSCFYSGLTPGAVGCTLSHLSILKDAYESNYEIIWVLEDDCLVIRPPSCLGEFIEKLDALIGRENWDVLYTDSKCGFNHFEDSHDCWRPDLPAFDQYDLLQVTPVGDDFVRIGARARTHSMIINRSGMKKILDFVTEHGIFLPYDAEIAFVPNIHLFSLNQDVVTFSFTGSDTVEKHF